jgi:CDP-diacylglycerol--serine O-phosphatidyltransferase
VTKWIPSLFTIANLFLGIVAIMLVFPEHARYDVAALMVILAMLLDGVDGRVARMLNAQSEFGKELDSLSDVISFGVAPAFIMYSLVFQEIALPLWALLLVTAAFPICGALRLARFNVKAGTPGYFTGMPIPAAGGILALVSLFHQVINVYVLLGVTLLLAYLMVSNLKYPSFKHITLSRKLIWIIPVVVIACVVIGLMFPQYITKLMFIPLVLYALYGLKTNMSYRRNLAQRARDMEQLTSEEQDELERMERRKLNSK